MKDGGRRDEKKPRKEKRDEELTRKDFEEMMQGRPTYTRGRGGAIRQKRH